jgi:hypothetical protein
MLCVGHIILYVSTTLSVEVKSDMTMEETVRIVTEASRLCLFFQDIDNKGSTKKDSWLVNVVVLITSIQSQYFSVGV